MDMLGVLHESKSITRGSVGNVNRWGFYITFHRMMISSSGRKLQFNMRSEPLISLPGIEPRNLRHHILPETYPRSLLHTNSVLKLRLFLFTSYPLLELRIALTLMVVWVTTRGVSACHLHLRKTRHVKTMNMLRHKHFAFYINTHALYDV